MYAVTEVPYKAVRYKAFLAHAQMTAVYLVFKVSYKATVYADTAY